MRHPSTIKHQGKVYVLDRKATARLVEVSKLNKNHSASYRRSRHRAIAQQRRADYEGWKNYATWAVSLWWSNDQGDYEYWTERAQEVLNDAEGDKSAAARELSDMMHESLTSTLEDLGIELPGPYSDLLSAAISEVDIYEIAEHWLSDLEYEGEEEDED